jgi:subfamily B ATP-binding cassette protein MsbA
MKDVFERILFFPSVTRSKILLLVGFTLAATFFEGFGVAMLFPVIDFIEKGKDFTALAESSRMWLSIERSLDFLSIPKTLLSLMAIVFSLLLIRQLFNYLKNIYSRWLSESVSSDIRSLGFQWFSRADMTFYDDHGVGELVNVLTIDGVRASGGIFTFFNLLAATVILLLYFFFLLLLSPGMTLFAMGVIGCVGLVLRTRIRKSRRIGGEVSKYNDIISASIVERLNGVRLLKLSASEDSEAAFVKGLSEKIRTNTYQLGRIKAKIEFLVDPMVIFAGLVILYFSVEVFQLSLATTGIFVFVLIRLLPYTKEFFNLRQGQSPGTAAPS